MRPLRLAMLLLLLVGSLVSTTGRAHAQELDGNTYADDEYGWSVAYDDAFWTGEEVDEPTYRGLNLSFEAGFGTLAVYDNGETDPAACLEATADDFSGSEVFVNFAPSRSLDAPKTDRDAEGEVFTTAYTSDETEIPLAFYIECREVDGGTLNVQLAVNEDVYEDSLPAFEELLAAIEIDLGGSTRDDDTPEPDEEETPKADETPERSDLEIVDGLVDNTYVSAEYGLLIEWDDREWTVEELEESIGIFVSSVDSADVQVLGTVAVRDDVDASDPADCVAEFADELAGGDAYTDFEEATRLDAPETDRDAAGLVVSYVFTQDDGDELELTSYLECRELAEGSALRVEFFTNTEIYEDAVPAISGFLSGIQVVPAGSGTDDEVTPDAEETPDADEETPEPNDPGTVENDIEAGELDGDIFTDIALGYTFTFDDRVWTAELLDDSSTAAVFLVTDDEELFATVTVDASLGYDGIDAEQCVADYADGVETIEGYSSLRAERTIDGLDPPRDGAGSVFSYTYTYEDDTTADLVAYVECRPISDEAMIRVNVQTSEESLDANAAVFQELLDGIEVDGGGNTGADDPLGPTDDETPTNDDDQEA